MLWRKRTNHLYGENYEHITDRDDWDQLNRELFEDIIEKWSANGVALISNAAGGKAPLEKLHVRTGPEVPRDVAGVIWGFTRDSFDAIFARAAERVPEVSDCYRIRNLGLPNNSLVFLIEHRDKARRTMLVFGGPRLRGQLERNLERVSELLGGRRPPATAPGGHRPAPAQGAATSVAAGAVPAAFPTSSAVKAASTAALEAREDYLDARREGLDYPKRIELEKIQAELRRRTRTPRRLA